MRKWLVGGLAVALMLGLAALFAVSDALTRAMPTVVDAPPSDLAAQTVAIESDHDDPVPGWFTPGRNGEAAVLLLHGIHAHRGHLVDRIRLFKNAGYATLAIDLDAHGENRGARITFGHRESASVHAALRWLRDELPQARIAVVGLSLGGAAAVLGPSPARADAFVLEAVFADILNATADRIELRFGSWARWIARPLVWAGSFWTDVPAAQLKPIDRMAKLGAPVLVIGGVRDPMTPIADTRAMFVRAQNPKELWEIPDAGHYDFERHAPEAYRERVLRFLARHLLRQG